MKIWKSLLVLFTAFVLALGGYWAYTSYFGKRKINSLELISQNAVFVFETYKGADTWNTLVNDPVWNILKTLPAFQKLSDQLVAVDSLSGSDGKIAKSINGRQVTLSFHPTGIESFDLLYTINLTSSAAEDFISEIKSRIPERARFQTRKYSDQEIQEYYNAENNRLWSLSFIGNVAVISSSSFLVEEAIRFHVNGEQQSFFTLVEAEPLNTDSWGRLLVSGKGLASLLKGVSIDRDSEVTSALEILQSGLALDLTFEENQLVFKGPLLTQDEINFTPSIQANIASIESIIANRTLAITQINLESIFETQKLENRAFGTRSTYSGEIQQRLIDRGFLDDLTGELYLLDLENYSGSDGNQALLVRTREEATSIGFLKEFQSEDSDLSSDYYNGNEILYISEEEFPAHLFSGKFTGFSQTFVTSIEGVLILTNSQQAMKLILDDYRLGNTWGQSDRAPAAKRDLSPTAGYSKIFLTDQIWDSWINDTNPSWSTFLQRYSAAFRSFPWISLKINQLGNRREATLSFPYNAHEGPSVAASEAIALQPSNKINFGSRLIYGPRSISNFQDKTEDILIQDENHVLHLINALGEEVYSVQLSGEIVSEPFQIDYYRNGKLQLLVATSDKIYGIDRLGNELPSYPLSLGGEIISNLNLVDYSNTKEYRYFINTPVGNLYLLDKTGEKLEGWNPMRVGEKSIGAPFHYRVPGKGDFMVTLTEKGNLQLFNRRGERQSGSSVKLGESFNSPLVVKRDPRSRSSLLVGITSNGEIIHANFSGEITYRNQLIKNDRDSQFLLIPDQKGNDFIFISKQFNEVSVLDRAEKVLFNTRVSDENLIYQYFDFGSNRQMIAITDLNQEFCYLYDMKGSLLTTMPLESTGPIHIVHQPGKGQYLIHTVSGRSLTVFQLAD